MPRGKLQYQVCTVDYLVTVALYTITHTMYAPPKVQATDTIIFNDARDMNHAYSCYILVKYLEGLLPIFPCCRTLKQQHQSRNKPISFELHTP